jgi:Ca-activated chloride channel family protein
MPSRTPLSLCLGFLSLVLVVLSIGCPKPTDDSGKSGGTPSASTSTAAAVPPVVIEVIFSSEKKDWADEAIKEFNASGTKTSDGKPIQVKATYAGSVEPIEAIVSGSSKPTVFSPASSLVLPLLNDAWIGAKGASAKPIVAGSEPLVLSPIVIAMWKPMAEALGYPGKKLGWKEISELAKSNEGWKAKGHPEWGEFRFGHTHPGYSNSGLIAVLAENYAAVDKTRDLTPEDVNATKTMDFVRAIEGSIVHYGRSTSFFYTALADHGPSYLSATVLYENVVVQSALNPGPKPLAFPLVALYPKEGTQWADHPYAVLDAPWVGAPEKDAAAKLKTYLMSRPIQERAMAKYGFRPALTDVALGAPIDAAHGADPKEPQTLLATPNLRTLRAVLDQWNKTKRAVDVVVVLDRSGSMLGQRIDGAREGLAGFLGALRPTDRVQLMTFNQVIDPPSPEMAPAELVPTVKGIFADGGTALYDAVLKARDLAEVGAKTDKKHIHAVVVLTDGEDRDSQIKYDELMAKLTPAEQGSSVRIFTIGYGDEANADILKSIATKTGGAYYHGDPKNIKSVYDEIASFF